MSFLRGHICDVSDTIHDATGQPTGLEASPSGSAIPFDQLKNMRGTLMKKISLHWSTFSLQMSVLLTHI
jgi:hypothetical protein